MKPIVLDSYALIAYLEDEEGGREIGKTLDECSLKSVKALVCVVNWGEVFYHFFRIGGAKTAQLALDTMDTLPINIVDVDRELTLGAAMLKAQHKLSYADCYAAALAKEKKATIFTGDKEFKQLEKEISVHWIK